MIKFIFFLFIFYVAFRLISKLFYFYLINKVKKRHNHHYKNDKYSNKKEGEVSIDKMPKKNKTKSDKLGDYVDYEEID